MTVMVQTRLTHTLIPDSLALQRSERFLYVDQIKKKSKIAASNFFF